MSDDYTWEELHDLLHDIDTSINKEALLAEIAYRCNETISDIESQYDMTLDPDFMLSVLSMLESFCKGDIIK